MNPRSSWGRIAIHLAPGRQVTSLRMVLTAVSAVLFSACDRSEERVATWYEHGEGVIVVRNDPPNLNSPPDGWTVRELLRIGSEHSENPTTNFGRIRGVEIDEMGRVYVLDSQAHVIRVFGADGLHLQDIGRRGEGPGEFVNPSGLVMTSDGHLLVRDNSRYTVVSLDGTIVETLMRTGAGGGDPVLGSNGRIYQSVVANLDLDTGTGDYFYFGFEPKDGAMVPVDTLPRPPMVRETFWVEPGGPSREGGFLSIPYSRTSQDHPDPRGGYWYGITDAMQFVRYSAQGDPVRVVERTALQAKALTSEDRAEAIEELRELFGERLLLTPDELPERVPYWSSFFVDEQARLWVERFGPEAAGLSGMRQWEVYDPEGQYLGVLEIPLEPVPRPRYRSGRLVGTVSDTLGVQHVVVFEVSQQ